ncbi:MAG: ATP synthase subunit C [Pseudomonadota bacterium]
MENYDLIPGWIGVFAPVVLSAIGSSIGCTIAGRAALKAMLEQNTGYGKFVGLSALPSSVNIYGIVVMFTLSSQLFGQNHTMNAASVPGVFGIGVLAGTAHLLCSIFQGRCCAAAIRVTKNKPDMLGLSVTPIAIVEGFSVFTLIFALMLGGFVLRG